MPSHQDAPAVVFNHVGKCYRIGSRGSLRDAIVGAGHRALRRRDDSASLLWALDDVSFEVPRGATIGLIGDNGAGKTTALKLISRVTKPTRGTIVAPGRLAALIELGAGFHPELTGRENVFLNGAILGMSRAEIERKYDAIVAFAELDRFMDTPVKRYSSGMFARLGFAVAAHVEPDVLLVDEVLAVGDVSFQRKCFEFIHSYVAGGRTTLFVSHNLFALEQLCSRLVWLERGRVRAVGATNAVLGAYIDSQEERLRRIDRLQTDDGAALSIRRVYLTSGDGVERDTFQTGQDLWVHVVYQAHKPVERPHFVLGVWDAATRQPVFLASMLVDGEAPAEVHGVGEIVCRFVAPPLMPKAFHVWGEVYGADRQEILVRWQQLAAFNVRDSDSGAPSALGAIRHVRSDAPVRVSASWHFIPDGHSQSDPIASANAAREQTPSAT